MGLLDVEAALVDWVWLWATVPRSQQPEREEVANIGQLGQGDTAGATW
jgi:hypothetical protein